MEKELAEKVIESLTLDLRICQEMVFSPKNKTEDPRHCEKCEIAWEARACIIQHMGW